MCFRERFEVFVLQMKKYGKASGQISELNTAPVFPEIPPSVEVLCCTEELVLAIKEGVPSLICAE